MQELFNVSVDEDDNIMIRSALDKVALKDLLEEIVKSLGSGKALEIEVDNSDKPKYMA